jgi:Flp pilus assembly protein TadB
LGIPLAANPQILVTTDFRITPVDKLDDDGSSQRIAPAEGKSAAEIRAEIAASELPAADLADKWRVAYESAQDPPRFSLGEMLAVVTIVSLAMAGVHWLPPPVFAGIVGFAMFGWLIWLSLWNIEARAAKLIWWSLLVVYLLALVISFLTVLKS